MNMFNMTTNSCVHDRMVTFVSRKGDREIINQVNWDRVKSHRKLRQSEHFRRCLMIVVPLNFVGVRFQNRKNVNV